MLGVGRPQVFLADRGGGPLLGEISDVYFLQWNRVRDDISAARIDVRAPDKRCCELLANARTVRHELVIFRDGVRVWEGPIIRINYAADRIELEARDPMWYASRRALDVELDYTYPNVGDALSACKIALERAFGTPGNDKFGMRVADFVQVVRSSDDARTAKKIPAYSRTCWEVVDEYATNGGLDYTTVGRRILLWDVHTKGWQIPDMNDGWFSDSLQVVEYGSEVATRTFRTTNNGKVSSAVGPADMRGYYGDIDKVDSDRDEGDQDPSNEDLTAMTEIAERRLEDMYPAPVRLLVPANTRLVPDAMVGINDLIPGAYSRVSALRTCRAVTQWQRLDKVTVQYTGGVETVAITLETAPSRMVEPR